MKCGKKLVLFTLFVINLVDQPASEVRIAQGTLSGKISADGTFFEYVGIPYATTNSSTRFKAPLPPPTWEGVFKAIDEISQCPQNSIIGVIGEEDCLKINVYVPAKTPGPFPVMVYIHGGAFLLGSGGKLMYAPDFLVQHEVIIVTFNYRLGMLGFLCLGIKEAPGNVGLKDQIAALKWVKSNIAAFGGDPDNITLFGQSAGGTSTSLLIASDATDGLFNRAIVQSGSSLSNWAINRNPVWVASLIAKDLGYNTEDPLEMYEIFSKLPFQNLVTSKPEKPIGLYFDTQLLHMPCVENDIPGEEAVIKDLPYNLINKNPKNIPLMFGTTSKEGLFLLVKDTEESLAERDKKYIFASDLEFSSEELAANVSREMRKFYFGNENISLKTHSIVSKLNTDLYFEVPAILESEIFINKIKEPVYNYFFNYAGGRNFLKYLIGYQKENGACHADEVMYLFKGTLWPFPVNRKDRTMIDWMTMLWTNFAKFGNPTPVSTSLSDLPVKWTPSTKENLEFLYIEDELKMGSIPNPESYRLWKDIYDKYRKKRLK